MKSKFIYKYYISNLNNYEIFNVNTKFRFNDIIISKLLLYIYPK